LSEIDKPSSTETRVGIDIPYISEIVGVVISKTVLER
jgi:hypothetical protein